MLGNVRKRFAKKLETLLLHFLEVVLCLFRSLSCIFEFFVGCFEPVLDPFEPFDSSHVWRHVFEFAAQGFHTVLEFFIQLLVVTLYPLSAY